jgi:2-polyprenyl-3-methyl-5-hydroxy-6-metoxy-1,4-benzoquinol methylase
MVSTFYFFKKNVINAINSLNIKTNNLKVLDVGSSSVSILENLGLSFKKLVLFDIKFSSLKKKNNIIYVKGNLLNIEKNFKEASFDIITAFDVIEHLKKRDAIKLIKKLKKITKKLLILYTPNGYLFQPPSEINKFQEHLCGFEHKDLENLEFNTNGCIGLKYLRGSYYKLKKPLIITYILSLISSFFTKKLFKEYDASIFAVYYKK